MTDSIILIRNQITELKLNSSKTRLSLKLSSGTEYVFNYAMFDLSYGFTNNSDVMEYFNNVLNT